MISGDSCNFREFSVKFILFSEIEKKVPNRTRYGLEWKYSENEGMVVWVG